MKEIKTLVEERKETLLRLKQEKEKALQNVPQGALRICHSGNRTQYYHRRDEKDSSGVYMPKKNIIWYVSWRKKNMIKRFSEQLIGN